ncbi:MAG: hypothetical protein KGH63_04580 [Candidatus Micrarchaeota archaeon]|nr:hypothetical protein [Candidatus Micrarchaeota archaeon]
MALGKRSDNPRPVLLAEVKEILKERSGQPDFGYEQQTSLDYTKRFVHLTVKDAKALDKELSEIEALKPESVAKIVDLLPAHPSTLQAILAKDKVVLDAKDVSKVMELVGKARGKMIEPEIVLPPVAPAVPAPSTDEKTETKEEPKAE